MNQRAIKLLVLIIVFFMGMLAYKYWVPDNNKVSISNKPKILYWVAPMNPSYKSDKPGKSPMGMDLVPVYDGGANQNADVVQISAAVENNLGVKIAPVERKNLSRTIDTVGYVTVDENNIQHVNTYTDGWVRELRVKTTQEAVQKGQLLLELYSPTLNNAQEELLLALKNHNTALIAAGKVKLETLGMSKDQIDRLVKTQQSTNKVQIYATQNGIVSRLNVREGQYVKPETNLMEIVDLSQIWIIAEVFERQSEWVKKDQRAIATLPYLPSKRWNGKVDYVYPELNPKTHTLRVRLIFPNSDLVLKPQMYANVMILSQTIKDTLAIPTSALIRTGKGDRVILALGKGRFKAQPVKIGIESANYYQVLSGIKNGDVVVTSAQFLIDSESNLQAELNRMQSKKNSASMKKNHEKGSK